MENKPTTELWDWAEHVAEEVTKLFPPPIDKLVGNRQLHEWLSKIPSMINSVTYFLI